jgi:C1A family cysteine protease
MNQRKIERYGWKPSLPDFRDKFYKDHHSPQAMMLKGAVVAPLDPTNVHNVIGTTNASTAMGADGRPMSVSLRDKMPPIFNQGQLGSCTANASGALFQFAHGGGPYSRLQIYYNSRMMEGTVAYDSGAFLRDVIQVLANTGAGLEADWPYIESQFTVPPPPVEMNEAAQNKALEYSRLVTRDDFRNCLVQGHPFVIGFTVYSSFEGAEVAQTGIVPMPTVNDQMMGGHAVCVIGYNANYNGGDYYEVRNSWGEDWGDEGNFWIPAAYLENPNLAQDAWTVRK